MKPYESLEMELVELEPEDVITSSGDIDTDPI